MSTESSYDVIVVGAGIAGSCTALYLAQHGKRALLLEQFRVGHEKGSSHGASRIIRCIHDSPVYLPLAIDAFKQWESMQRSTSTPLITKCGLLWLSKREEAERHADLLKAHNVEHEVLTGAEVTDRFPHLTYDDGWSALYEPGAGVLHAANCLRTVQDRYKELGGEVHGEEEVKNMNVIAGQSVTVFTNKATYLARSIVFAVGGWLPTILPGLPIKTQAVTVGIPFWQIRERKELYDPNNKSPVLMISQDDGMLYMIPGVDYDDKIKLAVHKGIDAEALKQSKSLPDWMVSIPAAHIRDHFLHVDPSVPFKTDTCIYTMSDDEDFILDSHPTYPNVIIGGGFSGTGFKFGLTVGRILARMALDEQDNDDFDLTPFRIDRHSSIP